MIPKVIGWENEYGFNLPDKSPESVRNLGLRTIVDMAPVLFGGLRRDRARKVGSFSDFFPGSEIKLSESGSFFLSGELVREEELDEILRPFGGSGHFLPNKFRIYVDCGHPEVSFPECLSLKDVIIYDKAGEMIIELCRKAAEEKLGVKIEIHKDNTDVHGHSYGSHENYWVEPRTFEEIITPNSKKGVQLMNFQISSILVCGSGKIGSHMGLPWVDYQISQRADFITESWSLDTMVRRAIINTRDRPYADPKLGRRLHVILRDANLCEPATLLKAGLTARFLKMSEDDFVSQNNSFLSKPLYLPPLCLKVVSRDLTFKEQLPFAAGSGQTTALEMLEEVLRLMHLYSKKVPPTPEEEEVLKLAEFFVSKLKTNFFELVGYSDWVTKYAVLIQAKERLGCNWKSPELKAREFAYHDMNPEKGIYFKLDKIGKIKHIVKKDEILNGIKEAPKGTRAYLAGKCMRQFPEKISNMSWDFIRFGSYRLNCPDPVMSVEEAEEIFQQILQHL